MSFENYDKKKGIDIWREIVNTIHIPDGTDVCTGNEDGLKEFLQEMKM